MTRPEADTLYDVLKLRAETQPDDPAYVYLHNGEDETAPLTYAQLYETSKSIASGLQSRNLKGERALLIFESDYDYIKSFFACICAEVISVPLHPPGKNKSMSRISAIAGDSGAKVILSTKEIYDELKHEASNDDILRSMEWILIDNDDDIDSSGFVEPELNSSSITYLQYTSGSTGIPKGVIVSHGNLTTNLTIIDKSHPHDEKSVMVTWLPIHHDMGLIYGMLLPFFCGYPCYFMTPQAFVQKPYRWLRAISKYRGTHNAAPNFAFELCANKISEDDKKNLDLSTWTVAMNAAEPVRAETLQRFSDYFASCGFRFDFFKPGYGLAEGTLILSTTFKDTAPKMVRFDDLQLEKHNKAVEAGTDDQASKIHVGHSHSIGDTRIAIVDPATKIECKEGEVGEVWASGASIAQGYWMRNDATEETFRAHISGTGEGPFLRTGDLGFIKDNELYITGRHKDLIIIRGQNHYPQDIEYTVEASHPLLRLGCVAAFPVEDDGEERIGIVQELQKNYEKDFVPEEVFKAIRSAVSQEHDLEINSITLIRAQTIPKTSSGKIQRKACREGFLSGTLEVIAEWKHGHESAQEKSPKTIGETDVHSFEVLKKFITQRLSQMMQIELSSVDPDEPFASYGVDSLKAVQISGELEEYLQKELPATLVYDYPTINLLAEFLSGSKATRSKQESQRRTSNEPIAIVGIGLRFPGGNNEPEQFYNFLLNGGDAIREIPEGRWQSSQLKDSTVRLGGFLDDVDKFDPAFYGISPREAMQIDPQQRLTLEVTWEALEDACIDASGLAGSRTGVFMGVCSYDYSRLSSGKKELYDVYTGTGTSLSIVANRISYLLDLRGPSISIDTACSSSLVALHTACRSIQSGEIDTAIAGGVNLLLTPDWNVVFTEADMLAPDGHCKTFDAKADGYVRSEGCGVVILKRLSDALNDEDRIYTVIKGSALNQDGKSNGLTAPNGPSQVDVITGALNDAGVPAEEIGYVEAHGTGTPLGDPIEVNSITEALEVKSRKTGELFIGSVKTNIGHLEAAAGIAGVIKTALGFYYGSIPQQINYSSLNPEIILNGLKATVAVKPVDVKSNVKYAGISSFGFGGTNAHVILAPPPQQEFHRQKISKPTEIVSLSARSEKALGDLASLYPEFIKDNEGVRLQDISLSANTGREDMPYRLAIVCNTVDDLRKDLMNFSEGKESPGVFSGHVKPGRIPRVAFLFPGQGAQYTGMGKELYDTIPSFRDDINKCNEILKKYLEMELLEVLFSDSEEASHALDQTRYTQPALFAVEYALGKLWMSWGIVPAVMMGHSAGEYVAACLAGVFSLDDGLRLVAERGRLMEERSDKGEMYTVFTDADSTREILDGYSDRISIASLNSPVKTVISGDAEAISAVVARLDEKQIEYKKINVSIASHSHLMKPMISEFRSVCESIRYSPAVIPVVSNISAELTNDRIAAADYWCKHILSPVNFAGSIKACVDSGITHFIDLGPKPSSLGMAQETVQSPELTWIPSFKKNFTSWQTLSEGLARLYTNGAAVDWKNYHKFFDGHKISLPHYPFQRQRYWIADIAGESSGLSADGLPTGKALLGSKVNTSSRRNFVYNSRISQDDPKFLAGHMVFGRVVFPGAGYAELALSAVSNTTGSASIRLRNIKLHSPLFLDEGVHRNLQTSVTIESKGKGSFEISKFENDNWHLLASGEFAVIADLKSRSIASARISDPESEESTNDFYETASSSGIDYSGEFRKLSKLTGSHDIVGASAKLSTPQGYNGYSLHPALLDMAFQTALVKLNKYFPSVYVPVSFDEIDFYGNPGSSVTIETRQSNSRLSKLTSETSNKKTNLKSEADKKLNISPVSANDKFDISIFDEDGKICLEVKGLRLAEVTREEFMGESSGGKGIFYKTEWKPLSESARRNVSFDNARLFRKISNGERYLKSVVSEDILKNYDESIVVLDELVCHYILDVIRSSGINISSGATCLKEEIVRKVNVIEKHLPLFNRLLEILLENGIIRYDGDKITFTDKAQSFANVSPEKTIDESKFTAVNELKFVVQCGRRLGEVLRGEADALEVLFPSGDFTLAGKIYGESPGFAVMNKILTKVVKDASGKLKKGRKLRILEIGAGTGSTTLALIKNLRDGKTEYTFTDVSSSFFENARHLLSSFGSVEFRTLDIEKDPASQGIELESFDIVIASNVIHATKFLSDSLANIRKLLRKGGVLLLNEATNKRAWIDLTFGMTDGWWRFEDKDIRSSHPLCDIKTWHEVLLMSGFERSSFLTPEDRKGQTLTGQHVICAMNKARREDERTKLRIVFTDKDFDEDTRKGFEEDDANTFIFRHASGKGEIRHGEDLLDFASEEQMQKLFADAGKKGHVKFEIIYVAGRTRADKGSSQYDIALRQCAHLLNITKTALNSGFSQSPLLRLVTRDCIHADKSDKCEDFGSAALLGFAKVINLEHPNLDVRVVDVDDHAELSALINEIDSMENERVFARRGERIFVPRISPAKPDGEAAYNPKKNFAYLVTGGFNGIGLLSAEMLAALGAKNIILAGRKGSSEEAIAMKKKFAEAGTVFHFIKSDVSNEDDVEKIFAFAKDNGLKIKGIIHSAGLLDDAVVTNQTPEKFANVMAPKAKAALLLHKRSKSSGLQFFVMYSSVASVFGSAGQANHSAANAFMDSLSGYMHANGQRATSINWGVWKDIGSAAGKGADKREKIAGIETIEPKDGMRALRRIFDKNIPSIGIFRMDWNRYFETTKDTIASEFGTAETGGVNEISRNKGKETLASKLSHTDEQDHEKILTDYFRNLISSIMGLDPSDIEPDIPLSSMGLDSLMAIELKNRVNMELGVDLNLVRYMEETDIAQLASELKEQVPKLLKGAEDKSGESESDSKIKSDEDKARDLLAGLEHLSEEELDRLLREMN